MHPLYVHILMSFHKYLCVYLHVVITIRKIPNMPITTICSRVLIAGIPCTKPDTTTNCSAFYLFYYLI